VKPHSKFAIPVLLASPRAEDRHVLIELLPYPEYTVRWAESAAEARTMLARHEISVVICDSDLPGGGWRETLAVIHGLQRPSKLIVATRHADERLWAEVLNLGGFDVVTRPWAKFELTRAVESAATNWQGELIPA
jgi:CheY-like chemotaxis protein